MTLNPQAGAFLDRLQRTGTPAWSAMTIEQARAVSRKTAQLAGPPEPVQQVEDRTLPGPAGEIRVRIYRPLSQTTLPAFVYFHGGGWMFGDLDLADSQLRKLANRAGCHVISVDYRLAPAHPFPAGLEDCYAVLTWLAHYGTDSSIATNHIAVGGESAGGNLAAAVALLARDRGGPRLAFQVLVYPTLNNDFTTPSYLEYGAGYGITTADSRWFWSHYLTQSADHHNPYAVPLRASDLRDLPPALIITAEYDPLLNEGEAYAERLHVASVPMKLHRYQGMIHGFMQLASMIDDADQALDEIASMLRTVFSL